jgi:hypothetical protein
MQQPTTVAGLSAAVGSVCALATRQITWPQAVPLLAGAIVSMLVPDNTVAKADAEALANAFAVRFFTRKG